MQKDACNLFGPNFLSHVLSGDEDAKLSIAVQKLPNWDRIDIWVMARIEWFPEGKQ